MKPAGLPRPPSLRKDRRAGTAVEFALVGLAFMAFIMAIINLGLAGYEIAQLSRSVQQTGRWAATEAAASYAASGGMITETCLDNDLAKFNSLTTHALPALTATGNATANGSQTTGNLTLQATWSGTAGATPGLYLLLTGTYHWYPMGFSEFGTQGIVVRIASAATVVGSATSGATVSTSCGTTY